MSTLIDPNSVKVPDDRQRKTFTDASLDELTSSFRVCANGKELHFGQLQPIVVTRDLTLVTGERRLRAMLRGGGTLIKAEYRDEVDPLLLKVFEYEENAKREDLTWQEHALAVMHYHDMRCQMDAGWTLEDTSKAMNISTDARVSVCVQVGRALEAGHERVLNAGHMTAAYNIITRERNRMVDTELSQIIEAVPPAAQVEAKPLADAITVHVDLAQSPYADSAPLPKIEAPKEPEVSITQGDFLDWAPSYSGRKFNFLHCDFPYGIGHNDTEQGGSATWGSYEDSPEVYWALTDCLIQNFSKLMLSSAHVMFWFSLNYYQETIERFSKVPGLTIQPFPLIWYKSDGRGIAPDVTRQPRRVYETALLMSFGDRKIIKVKNNCYPGPCTKELHISEKPEPMLRYFFEMFVDDLSEVLDPTCGSGSAIRAAYALKASRAVGLELNPEYASNAATALRLARNKAVLSEML